MAWLLCLAVILSLCPAWPAQAAGDSAAATGSIGVTVRFDLPQTREAVDSRDLTVTIENGSKSICLPLKKDNSEPTKNDFLNTFATVTAKNRSGAPMTNEPYIGSYEAVVSGLPAGTYKLNVAGSGYIPYTCAVELKGYSKHILIGTGDGTLPLGNVDDDSDIDEDDLNALSAHLGQANVPAKFDLDGDGRVDVTDLAYINYAIGVKNTAQVLETASMTQPTVDTNGLDLGSSSAGDLFSGQSDVTVKPNGGSSLSIPMEFEAPVEMEQIEITSPDGQGAVQAGTAVVETTSGEPLKIDFDISAPAGVHAIGPAPEARTVTIDLGKRVAVKKVTITVTKAAGQTGKPSFATVTKIEFLKDIVPKDPVADVSQVCGLQAAAGNGQVQLVWNPVRNVTGYIVRYGLQETDLQQSMTVNTNRATVTGLKNMEVYYFQVSAINGDWRGTPSTTISATPLPSSAPGAPSNLRVEPLDQGLRLSWGKTKDASYYQVFFREKGGSFQKYGGDLTTTSAVISGLTNGKVYEVAVKAGNNVGVGPYSATAQGTPKKEVIVLPELPADDRIPASEVASIVMADSNNVDRTLCPSFSTKHLIDNDASTYWVAQSWYKSSAITYTFSSPQDMNYMILVPYLSAGHKKALKTYSIVAKDAGGNVLLSGSYRAPGMTDRNYLVLPFQPVKGVKSLTISLAEWEGNGCRVSVSEMAFYHSDSLPADIAGLFADDAFTQLRAGVTAAQIDELETRLTAKTSFYLDASLLKGELALARELLAGQPGGGTVRTGFQSRSAKQDTSGQSASDLQPLGVSVVVASPPAGATARTPVAIYAQLPTDAPVYVVPTQYYGESGIWKGKAIPLTEGRNYIDIPQIGSLTDERGGPLYITYAGSHPEQIKLHVRTGGNVFSIPVLELSNWYDQTEEQRNSAISAYVEELESHVKGLTGNLALNVRNATEIATPSVLLSIPADQAWAGLKSGDSVNTLYQNVLAWEQELFVCNKVQGIISSDAAFDGYRYPMTTRQNIRYMRMFAGAFMYAAGNHVGVGYGSTSALVRGKPADASSNGLFGWGIAHEIGHNMDKLGKAEITNNIYSLAVQAWNGGDMAADTRLTKSNIWQGVYDKVSAKRPGAASNVFVQLGMYWQLHLAYDEAAEPLAFYNQFFKLWKAGEYTGNTYDERVALIASKVANKDLTEFFTHWGMALSDSVKTTLSQYPDETRAIWYLNDASRTYRLGGGTPSFGTTTLQTAVQENKVTLTIQNTGKDLLGYEIRRNDTPIAFTTKDTYTDDLGAANNLTYTYSIVPVDLLGNMGDAVQADQVRIAYDTTIPSDSYTVTGTGTDTLTFTMKSDSVAVTGIKVTGSGLQGTYTVRIQAKASDTEWTTVKTGTLSGSSTVGYFTKPGADTDDTRIWTYDAATVQVSGIPDGASVELLDYPGDRIDFYEGATVGYLTADYIYGSGAEDKIPANSLVILGTYRGDPVYNTVEVQARYSTTPEGNESATTIERAMNGYALLLAEIPADGQVSDLSDGIFIFVPDMKAEEALNKESGVTSELPFEIRALLYRTDDPHGASRPDGGTDRRVTSETLWISCPDKDTTITLQSSR